MKNLGPAILLILAGTVFAQTASLSSKGELPFDGTCGYRAKGIENRIDPRKGFTVSARVCTTEPDRDQMIIGMGAPNEDFSLYLYRDAVRFLVADGGASRYTYVKAPKPKSREWVRYIATYDGRTLRLWCNGKRTAEKIAPWLKGGFQNPLAVGCLLRTHERRFSGGLSDVCLWDRALSDAEVGYVYTSKAVSDGLIAHWNPCGEKSVKNISAGGVPLQRVSSSVQVLNTKATGFKGIWYMNQPSGDEYVYKYSGGMGVYCAGHIPMAVYSKTADKTFFCYGGTDDDNTTLLHCVSFFDHKTKKLARPTIVMDKGTTDAHDNPVISLDDSGYIYVFSSSHGRERPSFIFKSKRPFDISAFRVVWTGNFSYPQPFYVPGRGFLFVHAWYVAGRSNCVMTSDPTGEKWSERTRIAYFNAGHYQRAWQSGKKIGIAFDQHPKGKGLNWRTDVYYMETEDFGKTWRTAKGEGLTLPLNTRDNPALVIGYADRQRNVYIKGVKFDSKGRPVIVSIISKGYEAGPKNGPREWKIAKWTGAEWVERDTGIRSDNNYDFSTLYFDTDKDWRLIGASDAGPQPYNPGGEIAAWITHDAGDSWTKEKALTSRSARNQNYPRQPLNVHPDFYALWADGHGRKPSVSFLYFCDKDLNVFRLPRRFDGDFAVPEPYTPGMND